MANLICSVDMLWKETPQEVRYNYQEGMNQELRTYLWGIETGFGQNLLKVRKPLTAETTIQMSDSSSQPSTSYPTEWRPFDVETSTEVRQLSEDIYQIRTAHQIVTVPKEGFDYFRETNLRNFFIYLDKNSIPIHNRDN